jgi:hypothetical protein
VGERYLLVWDLDGTLGEFEALEKAWASDSPVRLRVRPGLATALRELSQAGFVHTLLTTAAPLYAEVALRATGLRGFFSRVECRGQRFKGDAEGVAAEFGIGPPELAHRVLFVGDRLAFDEPSHPEVVFHLEPLALARPAAQLARLVEHLREAGSGSIREGFRRIGRGRRRWFCFLRRPPMPVGEPVTRPVAGIGLLLLLERAGECPVIGFGDPPAEGVSASEYEVIPSRLAAEYGTPGPSGTPD